MKPKIKTNIIVALLVVAFCIFIALVMLFRIGKFSFGKTNEVKIVFNFVNGLDAGAPVRYAGALVGKVDRVEVLNGAQREKEGKGKSVLVISQINKPVDLTEGTEATINTMGFIGEKYVEIRPGPPGSPPLVGNLLVGNDPAQMEKLISSGQKLIDDLQVTAINLNRITKELDARLPGLTDKMDHALDTADRAMDTFGSPEAQDQIRTSLANLKVITTYGKIFTTTVAEKPWRLVWGGKVRPLPPESEILAKPAKATAVHIDPAPVSSTELNDSSHDQSATPQESSIPITKLVPDEPQAAANSAEPVAIEAPLTVVRTPAAPRKKQVVRSQPKSRSKQQPPASTPYSSKGRR